VQALFADAAFAKKMLCPPSQLLNGNRIARAKTRTYAAAALHWARRTGSFASPGPPANFGKSSPTMGRGRMGDCRSPGLIVGSIGMIS